jgi:Tfp pilus assembly protein PilN
MSQQINLYNPLFLRREKHFSAVTILWSLLVVTISLAGYGAYANYSMHVQEARAKYYEQQLNSKRSEMADTVTRYSPEGRNKQLDADVRNLESLLASRQGIWRALSSFELGTGSGFADYLEAFSRRSVPGVWLTAFSIGGAGGDLTIRGRVLRPELVSVFLSALGQEPVMQGRKVTELKLQAGEETQPAPGAAVTPGPAATAAVRAQFVEFSVSAPASFAGPVPSAEGRAPASAGVAR